MMQWSGEWNVVVSHRGGGFAVDRTEVDTDGEVERTRVHSSRLRNWGFYKGTCRNRRFFHHNKHRICISQNQGLKFSKIKKIVSLAEKRESTNLFEPQLKKLSMKFLTNRLFQFARF